MSRVFVKFILLGETCFRMYPISAKGAAFINSLGRRPRKSCNAKPPALKARFIPPRIWVGLTANRCVEARFQRLFTIRSESWGDAPGWYESALSALTRCIRISRTFLAVALITVHASAQTAVKATRPDENDRAPWAVATQQETKSQFASVIQLRGQ